MENQGADRAARIRTIEARLEEIAGEQRRLVTELAGLRSASFSENELPTLLGLPVATKAADAARWLSRIL